jgi:hypothetical protein
MPASKTAEPHTGRVALVTGAAHGIGQAIAAGLAERGTRIVLGDIDEVREASDLIGATGHPAVPVTPDVSDPSSIEAAHDRVTDPRGASPRSRRAGTGLCRAWRDHACARPRRKPGRSRQRSARRILACRRLARARWTGSAHRGDGRREFRAVDPVPGRVGQQRDQWKQFGEAAGPAMPQDQWDPAAVAGPLVHEMNHSIADARPVVCETVQFPLGSTPVEPVGPVAKQLFQPVPVGALRPPLAGCGLRQPGGADPARRSSITAASTATENGSTRDLEAPLAATMPSQGPSLDAGPAGSQPAIPGAHSR